MSGTQAGYALKQPIPNFRILTRIQLFCRIKCSSGGKDRCSNHRGKGRTWFEANHEEDGPRVVGQDVSRQFWKYSDGEL